MEKDSSSIRVKGILRAILVWMNEETVERKPFPISCGLTDKADTRYLGLHHS